MKVFADIQKAALPLRVFRVLVFVVCALIFFCIAFRAQGDPDFGWHLRSGQEILLRHAIPRIDWFSHTLPNFAWVDHEYASNILIALLNKYFGLMGPSIFYALVFTATLLLVLPQTAPVKISYSLRGVYALLLFPVFIPFIGVRPQEISWLFFALVLAIVSRMKRDPKSYAFLTLPLIFLLWANLHGGSVAIGGVLLGIIVAIEGLKVWYFRNGKENMFLMTHHTLSRKAYLRVAGSSLISGVVTFVNPYGYRIYEELVRTLTDSYSTEMIREWLSPNFKDYTGIIFLLLLFVIVQVLYMQYKRKMDFTQFVLMLIFLFMAMQSVRHIPLFALVMSPFLLEGASGPFVKYFEPILRKYFVFLPAVTVLVVLVLWYIPFPRQFVLANNSEALAADGNYPYAAVAYLKNHHLSGEMFNDYNWGGYLIQNLPQYKVFIDGRMPHWRTNDLHLFKEYNNILNVNADFEQKLDTYHVGFVLIPASSTFASVLQLLPRWHEVFHDSTAAIFVNMEVNSAR